MQRLKTEAEYLADTVSNWQVLKAEVRRLLPTLVLLAKAGLPPTSKRTPQIEIATHPERVFFVSLNLKQARGKRDKPVPTMGDAPDLPRDVRRKITQGGLDGDWG